MDDQEVPVFVPAAHDADVFIVWVKYQVAGKGLIPGDGVAVGVLGVCPSAVAYDVFAARHIVKYPVHEPAAIQPVGAVGACGGAAHRRHLPECAPAGVPADDQGFYSDR